MLTISEYSPTPRPVNEYVPLAAVISVSIACQAPLRILRMTWALATAFDDGAVGHRAFDDRIRHHKDAESNSAGDRDSRIHLEGSNVLRNEARG